MSKAQTRQQIVAAAKTTRRELSEMEGELQAEIDEIDMQVFSDRRAYSVEEKKRRKSLMADQAEVREAFKELAYMTLSRLDDSDEVKQLTKKMKQINDGLSDDLNDLKKVERYAQVAAKVADGMAKVAAKLVDLAV